MANEKARTGGAHQPSALRSPQDLAAGLFLVALALVGYLGALPLDFGQMTRIGPGMLPKVTSGLVGALGAALVVLAFMSPGERLSRWNLRGLLLVLGAAATFGATVRPLGLVVAGPLAVLIASMADPENRILPSLFFGVVMTLFCGLLFKEALSLPIPFDPMSLLAPLHGPYAAFKSALKAAVISLVVRG